MVASRGRHPVDLDHINPLLFQALTKCAGLVEAALQQSQLPGFIVQFTGEVKAFFFLGLHQAYGCAAGMFLPAAAFMDLISGAASPMPVGGQTGEVFA